VKNILHQLNAHVDRNSLRREVEEEFQFHIDMQAQDYEREGLTPEAARTKAGVRFGDLAQIKSECVQIALQNDSGTIVMKVLFTIVFLAGALVRSLSSELHVTRIGDVLMMIAAAGGLLLMCTRMRTRAFQPEQKPLGLGLSSGKQSTPISFDEKGRTPFERVRESD
jgi:hypothetical protein